MNERIKDTARTVGAETDETSDPPCFAFSPRSEYVNTRLLVLIVFLSWLDLVRLAGILM